MLLGKEYSSIVRKRDAECLEVPLPPASVEPSGPLVGVTLVEGTGVRHNTAVGIFSSRTPPREGVVLREVHDDAILVVVGSRSSCDFPTKPGSQPKDFQLLA